MRKINLTYARLRERLVYSEDDRGFLKQSYRKPLRRAGSLDTHGYRKIMIDGAAYLEQHLVFFYFTTVFPTGRIYHLSEDKLDNRFENLTARKSDVLRFRQERFRLRQASAVRENYLRCNEMAHSTRNAHTWMLAP